MSPATRWRSAGVAVRLALRDALRHRGRSLLIVLMVALPVLGLAAADVLARTMQLSGAERLSREIGRADAEFQIVGGRVSQHADIAAGYGSDGDQVVPGSPAYDRLERRLRAAVPAGTRLLDYRIGATRVRAGDRQAPVTGVELDLTDPLTVGMADLVSGRRPSRAGEVAVSPHLAGRLGLRVGATAQVGTRPATVVGVVRNPSALREDAVWTPPGAGMLAGSPPLSYLLASVPRPLTWADVQRFDAMGVAVTSRHVVLHEAKLADATSPAQRVASTTIGVATVAVGLAVLEVVLLAGAAFAVGARRQRRDLALVAATGADARQVRQVVLAGGAVLGAAGALAGVVAGVATGVGALPLVERLGDRLAGHLDVRPAELLGVAVVGLGTGLLAAVLPARTAARDDVVAALTGRRGTVATPPRVPAVGLGMVALGSLLAAYAAHPPARFTLVLAGAVLAELGFVVCAPALVGAAGRLATRLPLAPRLALRDAARHRGRTGPAVAAIMAAIAGSVAVSAYITSTVARERAQYRPTALIGQSVLRLADVADATPADATPAAVLAVATRDLGASGAVPLATTACLAADCHQTVVEPAPGAPCADRASIACEGSSAPAVGDDRTVDALAGRRDPGVRAAMARGAVVVLAPGLVHDGHVRLEIMPSASDDRSRRVLVAAYEVATAPGTPAATAVLPTAVARRLGLTPATWQYLLTTSRTPSQAQVDRAAADLGYSASVYVERGYQPQRWAYGLVALAVGAAIVTLGATGVTTALSAAESRPDLATLAAVGGAPWTRRTLAASQAGTVAALGAALGAIAGIIPAWAILTANGGMRFVAPWPTLAALVAGLPVVVAVAAGLLVRTRLPVEQARRA